MGMLKFKHIYKELKTIEYLRKYLFIYDIWLLK
jgi:hypothetical protein